MMIFRSSLIGLLLVLVSGCTTLKGWLDFDDELPPEETVAVEEVKTDFSQEMNAFFTNASVRDKQAFTTSPWGDNVFVKVKKHYYSAGGRSCYLLNVLQEKETTQCRVCEGAENQWVNVRPLKCTTEVTLYQ